jgi:hypothetical protein
MALSPRPRHKLGNNEQQDENHARYGLAPGQTGHGRARRPRWKRPAGEAKAARRQTAEPSGQSRGHRGTPAAASVEVTSAPNIAAQTQLGFSDRSARSPDVKPPGFAPATVVLHPARASIVSRATAGPVVMPLPRMPVTT